MPARIWCLLIDLRNTPIGLPFSVTTENITYIEDLQRKVKETETNHLQAVDASDLFVWRSKETNLNLDNDQLEQAIKLIDFSDKAKAISLRPKQKMKDLELDLDKEILLVQTPRVLVQSPSVFVQTSGAFLPSSFNLPPV